MGVGCGGTLWGAWGAKIMIFFLGRACDRSASASEVNGAARRNVFVQFEIPLHS